MQAKMAKSAITSGLKKLEEAWQEKDYYTAQQVYKTLYARFVYLLLSQCSSKYKTKLSDHILLC